MIDRVVSLKLKESEKDVGKELTALTFDVIVEKVKFVYEVAFLQYIRNLKWKLQCVLF